MDSLDLKIVFLKKWHKTIEDGAPRFNDYKLRFICVKHFKCLFGSREILNVISSNVFGGWKSSGESIDLR